MTPSSSTDYKIFRQVEPLDDALSIHHGSFPPLTVRGDALDRGSVLKKNVQGINFLSSGYYRYATDPLGYKYLFRKEEKE